MQRPFPTVTDRGKRKCEVPDVQVSKPNVWTQRWADYTSRWPQLESLRQTLETYFPEKITFKLPRLDVSSGNVLNHASNMLEKLFEAERPVVFKIGFTHDPAWRWGSKMYGYAKSCDQWFAMIVLYIAPEPFSPSMLEAALIDKYQNYQKGNSTAIYQRPPKHFENKRHGTYSIEQDWYNITIDVSRGWNHIKD